jgi:acetyl esterase/lipase
MGRGRVTWLLVAAVLAGCSGSGPAPSAPSPSSSPPPRAFHDVAYATGSPQETLDLYLPAPAGTPAPLVVWVHGGGWRTGDKSSIAAPFDPSAPAPSGTKCQVIVEVQKPDVDALNAEGYAVAAVNYRLDRDPVAAVQDVKAAVRFLRAGAAGYQLDPDRFAAWGDSAGGYNVVMAGVTGATRTEFDDPALGNPQVSSAVQAVVDWFGPTDAGNMPGDLTAARLPYAFIKPGAKLPPFLIAHGDADCIVPVAASRRLHDALTKAGADATLTVLPGAHHEDPAFMRTQLTPAMAFLDRVLAR